jgi:hypothetical protein
MSIDTERARVRAQILADQAERGPGETHTARTVMLAAWKINDAFAALGADEQRRIFGGAVFGRRKVRHEPGRSGFGVLRVVSFGSDYDIQHWSYAEIAALLNRGETVVGKRD